MRAPKKKDAAFAVVASSAATPNELIKSYRINYHDPIGQTQIRRTHGFDISFVDDQRAVYLSMYACY